MTTLILALSPLLLNSIMGAAKWIGAQDMSAPGKRFLLAAFALIGTVAFNALNGTPLDSDSVSSLLQTLIETGLAFLAAHGSYHLFWAAPPQR